MEYLQDCPEYEAFLREIYQNVQHNETLEYWTNKIISRPDLNATCIRGIVACKIQDLTQSIKEGSTDKSIK